MGTALRAYLAEQPDIELAAELSTGGQLAEFIASRPDVVVDLSTGPAVDAHGPQIVAAGLPYVLGATGYAAETLAAIAAAAELNGTPVLVVPNFSLGASLMIMCAGHAARLMHSPVVLERHHQGKADAPSGTALFTARRIAEARAAASINDRPSTAEQFHAQLVGSLGAAQDGVAVHAMRGAGYLADQEVSFCLPGETLRIEHRTLDRRCYMPGVIYAVRNIGRVRGMQIGLDTILEGIN